jgi:hypothetical protein
METRKKKHKRDEKKGGEDQEEKKKRGKIVPECSMCKDLPFDAVIGGKCGHSFCYLCVVRWKTMNVADEEEEEKEDEEDEENSVKCPMCKKRTSMDNWVPNFMIREMLEDEKFDEEREEWKKKQKSPEVLKSLVDLEVIKLGGSDDFRIRQNPFPPAETLILLKFIGMHYNRPFTDQQKKGYWSSNVIRTPMFIHIESRGGTSTFDSEELFTFRASCDNGNDHFIFISKYLEFAKE